MRVFTAYNIEKEEVLQELEEVQNHLDLGFSPVPTEKMHLTFQFFKEVDQNDVEEIKDAMDNISIDKFEAEVKGVGCFPSRDYIRVVWAGIEHKELYHVKHQISDHNVESNNDHAFKPHITMMRVKDISQSEKKKLQRTIREFEDHSFGKVKIDSVKLYKSELKQGGSKYSKLYEKKLS